jgi:sugar (pentulose or hexulose) kinase
MTTNAGTPRTFRLTDEAMAILDEAMKTFGGATRSDTLRRILDAATVATAATGSSSRTAATWAAAVAGDSAGGRPAADHLREAVTAMPEFPPGAKAVIEQVRAAMRTQPTDPMLAAQRRLSDAVNSALPDVLQAERQRVIDEVVAVLRAAKADGALVERIAGLAT